MTKEIFCNCAKVLQDYSLWERKLYECGMDLSNTPANELAEAVMYMMCDGDPDWAYDTERGFNWLIEWCFGETTYAKRHGREFDLISAGALYDFLVFMNEHRWED